MAPTTGTSRSRTAAGSRDPRATPAMRQYQGFKKDHPDCVLFFRMGDFYEMFFEDAVLAHQVLGITLTHRTAGVPMAGVPYHAVEGYIKRMIDAGHRVAVCDQVQDAADATGVVLRAVTRVLTPGTLVDETLLDAGHTNHVACVHFAGNGRAAIATVEFSTGVFRVMEFDAARLVDELVRVRPAEILFAETPAGERPEAVESLAEATGGVLTPRPSWTFRPSDASACLCAHFAVQSLEGFGLTDGEPVACAAGAVLRFLLETQALANDRSGTDSTPRLTHLRPPRRETSGGFVTLDATTLINLEIERTMRHGTTEGSLLSILDRCRTSMGKRLLRRWLCYPLRDIDAIGARHAAVGVLLAQPAAADAIGEHVGGVQDVARINGRLALGRATPRDIVALGRSIGAIAAVVDALEPWPALGRQHDRLRDLVPTLAPLAGSIARMCVEEPPAHLREGGLFRDGVDNPLDEARGLRTDANTWLAEYQRRLIEETGIGSLKVGFNKVFGYYIEITHVHTEKVPVTFSRKQTLKNAERYITEELKVFEDKVTRASSEAILREQQLLADLIRRAVAEGDALGDYADSIAEIDVLCCFADVARRSNYVAPILVEEPIVEIVGGRHPVLDRTLSDRYVPNDCFLGRSGDAATPVSLALITGPNMSGKSTYIRSVALITLLAHAGSFVPAERATIGVTDRILTRIGTADELHAGRSTFMVEMIETANILHHATERSLVILDEIGRGTSTLDGLSLAWAIAETLAGRRCRTLFATHYHELTDLADRIEGVGNLQVAVREWGDEIVFLHRILPGRSDRSYGIHVARLAGLAPETVKRAETLLETLHVQTEASGRPDPAAARAQMSLFTEYLEHPVIERLRGVDLDSLTPLEAFDLLRRLRDEARS